MLPIRAFGPNGARRAGQAARVIAALRRLQRQDLRILDEKKPGSACEVAGGFLAGEGLQLCAMGLEKGLRPRRIVL